MTQKTNQGMSRRNFVQTIATLAGGAIIPSILVPQAKAAKITTTATKADKLVGIQIGAVSFVDEGVNQVLDNIQEHGQVNTLFLATFTYDTGIGGRQLPGFPFPDHGKKEYQDFHGGNFATPHEKFYANTIFKDTKAPDHGNWDMLAAVLPETRKRGIKVYVFNQDSYIWNPTAPRIQGLQGIGLYGQPINVCCDLNPDYSNFVNDMTRDICSSYEIDGMMWSSERQGPFNNSIQSFKGEQPTARITCFCPYHRKAAKERGIDPERAIEGFKKLVEFSKKSTTGQRPTDGYFVEFWRIMTDYPEILAWEKLWNDGNHATYANVYKAAKEARPNIQAGFHIMHANTFSPFTRAEMPFERLSYADFIKPCVYKIIGGSRYAGSIASTGSTVFHDIPQEEFLKLNNHLMNYGDMSLKDLPKTGLPDDYVASETKRALTSVQGKSKIHIGLDIDFPTKPDIRQTTPEDVYNSTLTALKSGANGVIFSRKYSEMNLTNLAGGGKAVKDFYQGK